MQSSIWLLVCAAAALGTPRNYKREQLKTFPSLYHKDSKLVQLPSTFGLGKVSTVPLDQPALEKLAIEWGKENLPLGEGEELKVSSYLDSNGLFHAYFTKESNGLLIYNSQAQMVSDVFGEPKWSSNSWLEPSAVNLVKREESITCSDAVHKMLNEMQITDDGSTWKVRQEGPKTIIENVAGTADDASCIETLYSTENQINHVYKVVIPMNLQYLSALVDIKSGIVLGVGDLSSNFATNPSGRLIKRQQAQTAFKVQQIGSISPAVVPATLQVNAEDLEASPNKWLDQDSETKGNNVIAVDNVRGLTNVRQIIAAKGPVKGANAQFDFNFNDKTQDPGQYTDASVTNAFFLTNRYHDILERYGFDAASGNFQQDNLGKGGLGNDAVLSISQDGTDLNNANFQTPPDGIRPTMRMFLFNLAGGRPRDASLENSVVLHELTHGLTNRLTGGGRNEQCLQSVEAGGMGEGWSDMMAVALEMESIDSRNDPKTVGGYVTGNARSGIRQFPYSTDMQLNPLTFADVPKAQGLVHDIGTIWSSMLFEVYWNMVDKSGFDVDFRTNPAGGKGNNQFMSLFVQSLKLQPCFPTFITARDAWFAADQLLFQGANKCAIETGFAKRGLGLQAARQFRNDFQVSAECK